MNPNVDSPPSMHLPEPLPASPEQAPGQLAEAAPLSISEHMPQNQQAPPVSSVSQLQADDTIQAALTNASVPQASQSGLTANDDDKIEKEWVIRAKQIVDGTRDDPYQQNRQLAAFKADYMQKRYNKTIKLSE